jgi:hypothetical protein
VHLLNPKGAYSIWISHSVTQLGSDIAYVRPAASFRSAATISGVSLSLRLKSALRHARKLLVSAANEAC